MIKRAAIFFKILLLTTFANAQEIEWQNTIGGDSIDRLNCVISTLDGGFILGGSSISNISGDKTENSFGNFDYWVIKTDGQGNIQWQRTIGGNNTDYLYSILQTNDGGFLLGGNSTSNISGSKTEDSNGSDDYWIVKLDNQGSILWQNTIGGNSQDIFNSMVSTIDGGFVICGSSFSDISGDKLEGCFGLEDYWVLKIDSVGNILWQNTIGGSWSDNLRTIIKTDADGYLLGGTSLSPISGDKTEESVGWDFWIVKIDSLGSVQWENTLGGNNSEVLASIFQTYDKSYILSGSSNSDVSGDKSENSYGGDDIWLIRMDSTGIIQWQNTIGGSNTDGLFKIIQTHEGGFILGGYSNSDSLVDKIEDSQGFFDYWIIKTDSQGNLEWQNTIGGESNDFLYTMDWAADGSIIVGGQSTSNAIGDKTENSNGFDDFWILNISYAYNFVQGISYFDQNLNDIVDPSEQRLSYKKLYDAISGRFDFTNIDGVYSLSLNNIGNYEVSPDLFNSYFNFNPLVHNGQFTSFNQIDSLNDFAYQPTGTFNDLCLAITPASPFRSGFTANYSINYSNQGTTTLIPTIVFYPDSNVSFFSASIIPTTITPDSVVFVLGPLTPFQTGQITITVSVDLGIPIGTLINSGSMILPIANDANPGCNSSYWEVITTGSFDPNDILVNRSFIYDYELATPPDLEYIIRFQNTGNDTAFYIRIDNIISNDLQVSTIDIISSSHPCNIEYQSYDSTMKFIFYNILLPDSNVNEVNSHGFVRYKIKPQSTLLQGDFILNNARITFDYNAPIVTNTADTEIIASTGLTPINHNPPPTVFPNPANNKITIRLTETTQKISTITIYNLYGQQVENLEIAPASSTEVDISDLAHGVYFVKINNAHQFISKIVKY